MHPLTAEWISKAEADFAVMEREGRVRKNPAWDSVCFHAQRCAEKYLKGTLAEYGLEIGRVHDLVTLLEQLLPTHPLWDAFRIDFAYLSDFAVAYRYPGDSATRQQARDAIRRCRRFRQAARQILGIA